MFRNVIETAGAWQSKWNGLTVLLRAILSEASAASNI
jgi:hypothetical protein